MLKLIGWQTAFQQAKSVRRAGGKSVLKQFTEMVRLRAGSGRIMPGEYFDYLLYDDQRYSQEDKQAFRGVWSKGLTYRANSSHWRAVGDDKLLAHLIFDGLGLRSPLVRAVYHPARYFPKARMLRTPAEMERYLLEEAEYPIFAKPVEGARGIGIYRFDGVDGATGDLKLGDGGTLPMKRFLEGLGVDPAGVMLQEVIRPHPEMIALCGDRVTTIRMYVVIGLNGPFLHRAALRLPVGSNVTDNFKFGLSGNLAAAIDPADGSLIRVIGSARFDAPEIKFHPDTGVPFAGFKIPDWSETLETCLRAAAAFPGLRVQAWDIVPSVDGPLLLELNTRGDMTLPQAPFRRGIADQNWQAALAGAGRA